MNMDIRYARLLTYPVHLCLALEDAVSAFGEALAPKLLATLDIRLEVPFVVYSVDVSLDLSLEVAADL